VVTIKDIKFGLRVLRQLSESSLLFSSSLTSVTCYHCCASDDATAILDFQVIIDSLYCRRYLLNRTRIHLILFLILFYFIGVFVQSGKIRPLKVQ